MNRINESIANANEGDLQDCVEEGSKRSFETRLEMARKQYMKTVQNLRPAFEDELQFRRIAEIEKAQSINDMLIRRHNEKEKSLAKRKTIQAVIEQQKDRLRALDIMTRVSYQDHENNVSSTAIQPGQSHLQPTRFHEPGLLKQSIRGHHDESTNAEHHSVETPPQNKHLILSQAPKHRTMSEMSLEPEPIVRMEEVVVPVSPRVKLTEPFKASPTSDSSNNDQLKDPASLKIKPGFLSRFKPSKPAASAPEKSQQQPEASTEPHANHSDHSIPESKLLSLQRSLVNEEKQRDDHIGSEIQSEHKSQVRFCKCDTVDLCIDGTIEVERIHI